MNSKNNARLPDYIHFSKYMRNEAFHAPFYFLSNFLYFPDKPTIPWWWSFAELLLFLRNFIHFFFSGFPIGIWDRESGWDNHNNDCCKTKCFKSVVKCLRELCVHVCVCVLWIDASGKLRWVTEEQRVLIICGSSSMWRFMLVCNERYGEILPQLNFHWHVPRVRWLCVWEKEKKKLVF